MKMDNMEVLKYASTNIRKQGKRSWLTILGIVIGVTAIVVLTSVGAGLNKSVEQQFESLGTHSVIVLPGKSFMESAFSRLQEGDAKAVEKVRGVDEALEIYLESGTVEFKKEKKTLVLIGIDPKKGAEFESLNLVVVEHGRFLNPTEKTSVMLGAKIAGEGFERPLTTNDTIKIEGKNFGVVAVNEKATHFAGAIMDNAVIMGESGLKEVAGAGMLPNRLFVKVSERFEVEEVKERIKDKLEDAHGAEDFQVTDASQISDMIMSVVGVIALVLVGIAAISLFVGGIGILNTMVMAVTERTHEIGIMKAVGATNRQVLFLFLMEAGEVGLVGGIIGATLGILLSLGVSAAIAVLGLDFYTVIEPPAVLGAIGFAMGIGIIAGVVPARMAAHLEPTEALRKK